ncbi:hypothetical protein GYMLUDRAFT_214959 [Collybiopsis luxurians FD-317 M1]|nr:hypothetical protein GYMLUDRAFT_214959 [Collybiopsis luxurians FD-317 M1]
MVLLPLTVQDFVLRELSPQERLNYTLMNRESYRIVSSFNRRAFRIEKVLSPYFDDDEINEFRILQYRTGTLISGSTALQFFDLTTYEGSDLDLYVELRYCRPLSDFLLRIGYEFQPINQQPSTFQGALEDTLSLDFGPFQQNMVDNEDNFEGYASNGIANVFNFVRGNKKVQIIVSHTCAMDVILSFHSTCVMNVISYSHAYALYPRATFVDRVSMKVLRFAVKDSRHTPAREKYRERGWTIIDRPSVSMTLRKCSEFSEDRSVGDVACWVIQLPNAQGLPSHQSDSVRINSWSHSFNMTDSSVERTFTTDIKLKYGYCTSRNKRNLEKLFGQLHGIEVKLPANQEEDPDLVDREWASWVHYLINRSLMPPKSSVFEQIRARLAEVFGNEMPSFENHEDFQMLIFPDACTVSELLKRLVKFHDIFCGDLKYDITFRVSEVSKHVWTNVKIVPPAELLQELECKYSLTRDMIKVLKKRKVGVIIEGLLGIREKANPGNIVPFPPLLLSD